MSLHTKTSLPGIPNIESPFFGKIFNSPYLDIETQRVAFEIATKGYAVIDFPDANFEHRSNEIMSQLEGYYDFDEWRAKRT